MIFFLQRLEPLQLRKDEIIYGELESVDLIYFLMEGQVDIGYEMNRINHFKIRIQNTFVVGAFECSFNRRS